MQTTQKTDVAGDIGQLEEEVTALAERPFITLEGLKSWEKGNCLSTPRDHRPSETPSTEALHKCGKAFMEWKLKPTAENAAALAKARARFRELAAAEFGTPVDQQSKKNIAAADGSRAAEVKEEDGDGNVVASCYEINSRGYRHPHIG